VRVWVIDNYDSFTFNLVAYVEELGAEVIVERADQTTVAAIREARPDRLLISPGPGRPETAGVSLDAIRAFAGEVPLLGVCLGHQAIAVAFGGNVVRAPRLMHGRTSAVTHTGKGVLAGLPSPFTAMRYHSLAVDRASLPEALEITAETSDGTIMAMRHRRLAVEGVQFHPESFLTEEGRRLLGNWLSG
jgi:anthranilate synthase/aminodeoxychorismate synthase-like glutamine amidotransferase